MKKLVLLTWLLSACAGSDPHATPELDQTRAKSLLGGEGCGEYIHVYLEGPLPRDTVYSVRVTDQTQHVTCHVYLPPTPTLTEADCDGVQVRLDAGERPEQLPAACLADVEGHQSCDAEWDPRPYVLIWGPGAVVQVSILTGDTMMAEQTIRISAEQRAACTVTSLTLKLPSWVE